MRVADVCPKPVVDELLRLYKADKQWWRVQNIEPVNEEGRHTYSGRCGVDTWMSKCMNHGGDGFSLFVLSKWLGEGPKIFRPTKEQQTAMEQVEVNVLPQNYKQPFPAIFVEFDVDPFVGCLCGDVEYEDGKERALVFTLYSKDNLQDITTTVVNCEYPIEKALQTFDDDCKDTAPQAIRALRIAVNCCLALVHFGCHSNYLFPKEVESDRRLSRENSERGQRAMSRLHLAVQQVSFDQEIKLHRVERRIPHHGEPTGMSMPPHWRRGHWASQPWGPKQQFRKLIFRPPVMIRPDLFVGDVAETQATYKG